MRTPRRFQPSVEWMPTRIAPTCGGLPDPTDPVDVPTSPMTTVPIADPTEPVDVPAPNMMSHVAIPLSHFSVSLPKP